MSAPASSSQPVTSGASTGDTSATLSSTVAAGTGAAHFSYWAFISYSHSDEKGASWLHRTLETYRVPATLVGKPHRDGPLPRRLIPIFRDRDELASGHDLNEKIQAALTASRYIIVLCSPRSAKSVYVNEEIRRFKLMGRRDRILAIILEGEPKDAGGPQDCFPPALRHPLREDGTIDTSIALDPIAADARPGKDGPHNASLKVLAGMLEVGLDTLLQREKLRRRRYILKLSLQIAAVIALVPLYVLAADSGLMIPAAQDIRNYLDSEQLSVLRRPAGAATVCQAAARQRADLMTKFAEYRLSDDLYTNAEPKSRKAASSAATEPTYWNSGQILSAISRNPDLTSADGAIILRGLKRLFEPGILRMESGAPIGWNEANKLGNPTQGEIGAWICTAVAAASGRSEILLKPLPAPELDKQREALAIEWATITQVMELHDAGEIPGAWAMYPRQQDKKRYSHYTSTLMLMALLEARQSGLAWGGSIERRDELLRDTAALLIRGYEHDLDFPGWQSDDREEENRSLDGLTLQIYALLLRAENDGAIPPLPKQMTQDITAHLIRCEGRNLSYPVTTGEFSYIVMMPVGNEMKPTANTEAINFHWYPWAIEATAQWLRRSTRVPQSQLHLTRVRRTLSHLVVELGPEALPVLGKGGNWTLAELLYCLGSVRPGTVSSSSSLESAL
ncbi:MAG TPA: toll/interleukin-1 receptor domain-containing protein [Candidatus Methylacidiphilales bacterium]|nr:toll/interleukin-1 receptor domain-containing protein [Candidatus Methylacidiphilales bacterium]